VTCLVVARGLAQDDRVDLASEPRVLLVIDTSASVQRRLADDTIRAAGLLPAYAADAADACAWVATGDITAMVVLPPLRDGDCFALVQAARRHAPDLIGAIVLGEGRFDEAAPRVLWSSPSAVPTDIVEAVAGVATLQRAPAPSCWDETTAEIGGDPVGEWFDSL
jgi:hypothetical protein